MAKSIANYSELDFDNLSTEELIEVRPKVLAVEFLDWSFMVACFKATAVVDPVNGELTFRMEPAMSLFSGEKLENKEPEQAFKRVARKCFQSDAGRFEELVRSNPLACKLYRQFGDRIARTYQIGELLKGD